MKDDLGIVECDGKFIVTKNGNPIRLPKTDGASIVTEFDSKQDAQTYINILKNLRKSPIYA